MQIEVARLAKEIETVKFHEEMMRANFTVQKTELESKVTVLLGLIASWVLTYFELYKALKRASEVWNYF